MLQGALRGTIPPKLAEGLRACTMAARVLRGQMSGQCQWARRASREAVPAAIWPGWMPREFRLAWGPDLIGFAHCVAVYGLSHWSRSQGFAVALDCCVVGVDAFACVAVCGSRNVQH